MQNTSRWKPFHLAAGLGLLTFSALCCAGGLDAGTQAANNFKIWFYAFVGICSAIYLCWEVFKCWSHKGNWLHEVGGAVALVALAGATAVLAPWAWSLFTS